MRALLASLLYVALMGPASAGPASSAQAQTDVAILQSCIAEAMDVGPLDACIGAVSGPCIAQPGGETTAGLVECHGREHAAWDAQLNAVYRRLDGASGGPLQRAQRAWITFRDANCEAMAAPFAGGSITRVIHASCMAETTARRAIELLAFERAMEI